MSSSIFVSYASDDEHARRVLDDAVEGLSLQLLDLAHRGETEDWRAEYRRLILQSNGLVVLVGKHTSESEPVRWEIAEAKRMGRPLIGFRIHGATGSLPLGLPAESVTELAGDGVATRLISLAGEVAPNYLEQIASLIGSELTADQLPDGPLDELLVGYAVLVLTAGDRVSAADVHNAWCAWMMRMDPTHPALMPYEHLDPEVAQMDEPYVDAIHRVARSIQGLQ